jgi:thiamine-monophosphate kinase
VSNDRPETAGALTVAEIGEFALIERLRAVLPVTVASGPDLPIGIGDDAALWRPAPGRAVVITTDSLVEAIHFRLEWTDWSSLGHKLLAVNLSDLAAMGAEPALATVSLGLRGSERVDDLLALYGGLGALAARTGTVIAGGDIVASPAALTIHVTAIGQTDDERVLTRAGAKAGDIIAVSGTIGAAAAGLRLLAEGENAPRRRAATADHLIAAHLRPEPRLALGRLLVRQGATAAMDLSDGLFGDVPKLLAAGGTESPPLAARIERARLPVAAAVRTLFPDDWFAMATRGGEDYELLFTAPEATFAAIAREADTIGATVTAIGTVIARATDGPVLVMREPTGEERAIEAGAFDHFRQ